MVTFEAVLRLFLSLGADFLKMLRNLTFGGTNYIVFVVAVFVIIILIDNFLPRG